MQVYHIAQHNRKQPKSIENLVGFTWTYHIPQRIIGDALFMQLALFRPTHQRFAVGQLINLVDQLIKLLANEGLFINEST